MMTDSPIVKVDLQPIADVCIALLDKLEKAVGWIASPKGTQKEAIDSLIKSINGDETLNPLAKAALINNARRIIKEYSNQQDIIDIATKELGENARPDQLNDDWISHLLDSAKHVSERDVQIIWGKILANECENPGTVPKTLIHALSHLDRRAAMGFKLICKHTAQKYSNKRAHPMIDWYGQSDYFTSRGLSQDILEELDQLGLIIFYPGSMLALECLEEPFVYNDFWFRYVASNSKATDPSFVPQLYLGQVSFTNAGEVLYRLLSPEPISNFWEYLQEVFKDKWSVISLEKFSNQESLFSEKEIGPHTATST